LKAETLKTKKPLVCDYWLHLIHIHAVTELTFLLLKLYFAFLSLKIY